MYLVFWEEPGNITAEEWEQILAPFPPGHPLRLALEKLRGAENKSQRAVDLFDNRWANQLGPEYVNNRLRANGIGFRLTRIGAGTQGGSRMNRRLAIVRWNPS